MGLKQKRIQIKSNGVVLGLAGRKKDEHDEFIISKIIFTT